MGGGVSSTGSSLKASQVTVWPKFRISNSLLTLGGEESQPCKVDEETQHAIMSVEILCKLDSNMHTYASCRLWLLDTDLKVGVQMWMLLVTSEQAVSTQSEPPHLQACALFSPALSRQSVLTCTCLRVSPELD